MISRRTLARHIAQQLRGGTISHKKLARHIAAYLVAHKMANQAQMLLSDIAYELRQGHLYATATSARPLTDTLQKELIRYLKTQYKTGHVELTTQVDPSLVGGVLLQTPDAQLDLSIRRKLTRLEQS